MSRPVVDRRSHRRLHAFLLVLAAVLGVLAVCLIVFGSSPRQLKLGAIVGLWAGLIAAFQAPAFRRQTIAPAAPLDLGPITELLDQHRDSQHAATKEALGAQSGELRRAGELQMARDSAARREADVNLQLAMRHEIERTMADQFGVLRQEVSSLRAEVFDKLGGQIKLERIETTRLIGSDLEALQNQIRRLAEDRERRSWPAEHAPGPGEAGFNGDPSAGHTAGEIVDVEALTPAAPRPLPVDPLPADPPIAAPAKAAAVDPSDWSASRSVRSKSAESTSAESMSAESKSAESKSATGEPSKDRSLPAPSRPPKGGDPFADLPRLTPIPPEVLEPLPASERSGRRRAPLDDPESPRYVGRRRPDLPGSQPPPDPQGEGSGRRRAPGHASD